MLTRRGIKCRRTFHSPLIVLCLLSRPGKGLVSTLVSKIPTFVILGINGCPLLKLDHMYFQGYQVVWFVGDNQELSFFCL